MVHAIQKKIEKDRRGIQDEGLGLCRIYFPCRCKGFMFRDKYGTTGVVCDDHVPFRLHRVIIGCTCWLFLSTQELSELPVSHFNPG